MGFYNKLKIKGGDCVKLDLYGCTYVEVEYQHFRYGVSHETPFSWCSLRELEKKKVEILNRKFENCFSFYFIPNQNKPIFLKTFEVDKFDPKESVKINDKEYRVLHHFFDVENNKQVAIINKELKRELMSQEKKNVCYEIFTRNKEDDLLILNQYIEGKKPFWSKLFKW